MSFTSYAQNFEDVMLWRALKHVQNGVYIDVGAQHPVIDSVSKAFYERGWKGMHIEPVLEYAQLLREDRPDEAVLQVALADIEGTLELNVIPATGLSTAIDAIAARHEVERDFTCLRIQVPVLTLKSVSTSLIGKDVHWLKIDVEGFEGKVLQGWDSQILRPWIMVIEATIPVSSEIEYASWDPILIAADYQFVYFDGLNRFYIAKEHAELAEAFCCPPNVFDEVQLSGLASSELCRGLLTRHQAREQELTAQAEGRVLQIEAHATQAETRIEQAEARAKQAELQAEQAENRAIQAEAHAVQAEADTERAEIRAEQAEIRVARAESRVIEVEARSHTVLSSRSWRITEPLRLVGNKLHRVRAAIRSGTLISGTKKNITLQLRQLGFWVLHRPRLTQASLKVIALMPGVKYRLRSIIFGHPIVSDTGQAVVKPRDLSPRATCVYDKLKQAADTLRI